MIKGILCDVDGTLYPLDEKTAIKNDVASHMLEFIRKNIAPANIEDLQKKLREEYRSTALGLSREFGADITEFYNETYDKVNVSDYITHDSLLQETLRSLGLPIAAVTNSPSSFSKRILSQLGCEDCFSSVSGEDTRNFILKPNSKAYAPALAELNLLPSEAIVIDNNPINLAMAKEQGMYTVLVGELAAKGMRSIDCMGSCSETASRSVFAKSISYIDYAIPTIYDAAVAVRRIRKLDEIINSCEEIEAMQSGSTKCTLHSAQHRGSPVVIKIAHDIGAEADISENIKAYSILQSNAPRIYASAENIIVMEDLRGKGIEARTNNSENADEVYNTVARELQQLCERTIKYNPKESVDYLNFLFGPGKQGRYFQILKSLELIGTTEISALEKIQSKLNLLAPPYVTFVTGGELQPEHLYIRDDESLVILDPREPLVGIPIIDFTSCANLFQFYKMNRAEQGQRVFDELCEDIGKMCSATPHQIKGLRQLATLRQMTNSARFRQGEERTRCAELAKQALYNVEDILR